MTMQNVKISNLKHFDFSIYSSPISVFFKDGPKTKSFGTLVVNFVKLAPGDEHYLPALNFLVVCVYIDRSAATDKNVNFVGICLRMSCGGLAGPKFC